MINLFRNSLFEFVKTQLSSKFVGDAVAKWLARWTTDGEVFVQALSGLLLYILGQYTLLSQCISPPRRFNGYQKTVRET